MLEKIAVTVEITVKVATTQTLLEVFANRFKPLIIHFIGHGMTSSNGTALVLEDKVGIARPFTEDDLKTILDSRREPPCQLALLNACHSEGLANALIKSGVSHVIAVNAEDTILDIAARCFSRHLYQALFNGILVVDSFLQSRKAVKIADELRNIFDPKTFKRGVNFQEAFKFQLLPENSREHNQSLKLQSVTAGQVIAPSWENTNVIPSYDSTFVGRRQDLLKIAEILANSDYRCVALHGMGGMGKTALAYAAGRWHHERERFRDGVYCGATITSNLANYNGKSTYANEQPGEFREKTTVVGSFPPNAFGLYDMHGNVWEWCVDDWHNNYRDAPQDGTAWLSKFSNRKVLRSDSWAGDPSFSRSAYRDSNTRGNRDSDIGFRVVRVAPRTT